MSTRLGTALFGGFVAALAVLPGLGTGTLWDNSETAYGEVAREILLTHDWVVMHLNGAAWFVQPPLYFWLAALFAKWFGVEPLWLRFPSALATIAMGMLVGCVGARLAGRRAGAYAAVILSTSLMQAVVGRLAIMDALLDLAVAFGILAMFRALCAGRTAAAIVVAAIAIALGVLAKGPVALAVVALVIVPWALWERARRTNLTVVPARLWILGAALLIAIDAPWFALLAAHAGGSAVRELIGHYTFGRYVGTIENQSGPIWYYIPVVILGFFPWVAFLPASLMSAWKTARLDNDSPGVHLARLALAWAIVPFLFFSFAQTKLPNYIALELPALALLVALWFDRVAAGEVRRGAFLSTAVVPLTIGAFALAITVFAHGARLVASTEAVMGDLLIMAAIVLGGSIGAFLLLYADRPKSVPYALGGTALAMIAYTAIIAEPHAERFKPVPQLAAVIRQEDRGGDTVAIRGVAGGNALMFYTQPPIYVLGDEAESREVICGAKRVFLVTSKRGSSEDPAYGRDRHVLATAESDALVLYDGAPCNNIGSLTSLF
jgi:4-amino-4-deoxy-L-arabinose transferase-like glycosyltransferase